MHIEKLILRKLNNTRDLGGLPAEDGRKIRKGKLIRSGQLYKLPFITRENLRRLGVTAVVDLRIDTEVEEYPAAAIEGARYIRIPLVCTATAGITHEKSMRRTMFKESKRLEAEFGSADDYMRRVYSSMLFNGQSIAALREIFGIFLTEEGCVLWNCSGGKDRTGIVAMLLESLLGVDEEVIKADYVASQRFQRRKRNIQKIGLRILPASAKFKRILFAFMDAKPQYITGAIAEIREKYGSVKDYCKTALGLTESDIARLKDKYLEPARYIKTGVS